jgi:simple sugar transport system permease protein
MRSLIAVLIGLALSLFLVAVLGDSPLQTLATLFWGAFGGTTDLGYGLFYATPLIFTGLSVRWALRAGLFNIGAEGQMLMGALAMTAVGTQITGLPSAVAPWSALFAGAAVGALWGGLAGWLKAKRGVHEVLGTILLNFVAMGLVSFVIIGPLRDTRSQIPETIPLSDAFRFEAMPWIGGSSPLSTALLVAICLALLLDLVGNSTLFGFRQRWVGEAPRLAAHMGLSPARHIVLAMAVSGGVAGLAGSAVLLGETLKLREGISAGVGFMGIAVALLGGASGLGVVTAAVGLGLLAKGAIDLDISSDVISRDLALVIQALLIILVASKWSTPKRWRRG